MRTDKDYVGNKHHSLGLARRITKYWRERGLPEWEAWVEERKIMGTGGRQETFYDIRSNIVVSKSQGTPWAQESKEEDKG